MTSLAVKILLAIVLGALVVPSGALQPAEVSAYDVCSDDDACIHEYMADQGRPLFPNAEIDLYWADIHDGAGHEDELDHIYSLSWAFGSLVTITHFWDADNGADDPVSNVIGTFPNGWQKVKSYWALALGAYAKGDKKLAYHWLGHVVHHMGDNTLPTHVHEDMHFPDDDAFEEWMSLPGLVNAGLTSAEKSDLLADGPLPIPADQPDKLYWLLYATNQIADFFGSDDYDGDAVDPEGWVQPELAAMEAAGATMPRTAARLDNNDDDEFGFDDDNDDDGDLSVIREWSYLRGIRSIAALYKLFTETVTTEISAAVVIDSVSEDDDDHDVLDGADYWSRVSINGVVAQNRGDEIVDTEDITPGWAYGQVVGTSGVIPMWIEIWDHDGGGEDTITFGGDDDQSDITPNDGLRLDFTVDVAKCLSGADNAIAGEISGKCRDALTTTGNNDDEASILGFRVIMSKSPPVADAGVPYTTKEGTDVTLDAGGSSDPDNDITTYAWDLDGDGNCDDVANDPTPDFTAVGQDGSTTVKVCVTDATGLTDDDTTTVTVTNEAPSISATSDAPKGENTTVTVSGTFTDPGWLDSLSGTISWGDGGAPEALVGTLENGDPDATLIFSATHIYGDNGAFTAQVCARDDDTAPCTTIALQIDNTVPTAAIDLSGAISVNGTPTIIAHAGQSVAFSGRSTDPGSDDLTLGWAWGDGTAPTSNVFLVNPPGLDPILSPTIDPRDVTSPASHTFGGACAYETSFTSTDDDGGTVTDTANVIIVGNGHPNQPHGYWKQEFRYHLTGKGPSNFDATMLGCYLDIAGYMSRVFDELTAASTFAQAYDVLDVGKTSVMTELYDLQVLAAWMNFANGAIEFDRLVDTNGDKVADARFLDAITAAETLRLAPTTTRTQLERQKAIIERWTNLP